MRHFFRWQSAGNYLNMELITKIWTELITIIWMELINFKGDTRAREAHCVTLRDTA